MLFIGLVFIGAAVFLSNTVREDAVSRSAGDKGEGVLARNRGRTMMKWLLCSSYVFAAPFMQFALVDNMRHFVVRPMTATMCIRLGQDGNGASFCRRFGDVTTSSPHIAGPYIMMGGGGM